WWSNAAEHWHARALIPRDARGPSTTLIHHIVIELLPEKRAVFVSLSGTGLRPALFNRWTQGLRHGLLDSFWPVDATGPAPRQRSDASPALAPCWPGLLAGQRQIGFDLDHVGQLEDQQLRDLHAMVGERGRELRPDSEVVGGEAKTLLRFEVPRCELHVGDARVRRDVDGLVAN